MSKRGIRYIGMFLIYLVILPVLHTANVTAVFTANVHGYDGIAGFRKASGDATIINSSASIEGQIVLPSQVKLISDPTRIFSCTDGNASEDVYCIMTIPGALPPGP
ncbi:hypothetical protein KY363_08240, partial [Candidatus Woesearchaeota archaeon]|nr:hypothetical protein [Candidatus Woesearchaeota archaeon]